MRLLALSPKVRECPLQHLKNIIDPRRKNIKILPFEGGGGGARLDLGLFILYPIFPHSGPPPITLFLRRRQIRFFFSFTMGLEEKKIEKNRNAETSYTFASTSLMMRVIGGHKWLSPVIADKCRSPLSHPSSPFSPGDHLPILSCMLPSPSPRRVPRTRLRLPAVVVHSGALDFTGARNKWNCVSSRISIVGEQNLL